MIKKDFIQELLIKPTPEDLKIYKRMGLDEYVSPTGARYPLNKPKVERDLRLEGQLPVNPDAGMFDRLETMDNVQSLGDYFQASSELFEPKSRINRDFVDSLAADEHPDVLENKSKLPPVADPDQPLTHFADPIPPTGIPDIADPQGLTADIKQPVSEDAVRALAQIPKGLARGTESVVGTLGSMAQWAAERTKIGDVLTKHIDLPGVGVVAEYLVRKFGPKKPTKYFDERMTQYAGMGEKWADFWEEQTQKGWEAPDPEVTQAKWRDLPITKGAATISEAAPNYLAAIAGSVLTKSPQTGLLFISALSGAGAYRRQRKAGAGKQKANAIAALTGAWEYVTEKVPFDEVFKPAKSKFLKMLKLGTLEAAQEFIQGIGENFLEYFGYKAKDLKSVPAAVKEGLEHTMDGWVENVVAGAGLGVMGGGIVPKGGLQKPTGKDKTPPTEAKEAPEQAIQPQKPAEGLELPPEAAEAKPERIEQYPGDEYKGKAWRAEPEETYALSSFAEKGRTLEDVMSWEYKEMDHPFVYEEAADVLDKIRLDSSEVPASRAIWVADTKEFAKGFGKKTSELELPKESVILSSDKEGGYLILLPEGYTGEMVVTGKGSQVLPSVEDENLPAGWLERNDLAQPPTKAEPAKVEKQPWEMTLDEYRKEYAYAPIEFTDAAQKRGPTFDVSLNTKQSIREFEHLRDAEVEIDPETKRVLVKFNNMVSLQEARQELDEIVRRTEGRDWDAHRAAVEEAVKKGIKVEPNILKEYRDWKWAQEALKVVAPKVERIPRSLRKLSEADLKSHIDTLISKKLTSKERSQLKRLNLEYTEREKERVSGMKRNVRWKKKAEIEKQIRETPQYESLKDEYEAEKSKFGGYVYYVPKGESTIVDEILAKKKGLPTKLQRLFTHEPKKGRHIDAAIQEAFYEAGGEGVMGYEDIPDVDDFVNNLIRLEESDIMQDALEQLLASDNPYNVVLATKWDMLNRGTFTEAEIKEAAEKEFRYVKESKQLPEAPEQKAKEVAEKVKEKVAEDFSDFFDFEEERPTDLIGRPLLRGGAEGKQLELGFYADAIPPTDVPSKTALHNAVARALNEDYKKVEASKRKYKGVKNEKQLYEKYDFPNKLFIHPDSPYPELRAAWTIATKGKALFGAEQPTAQVKPKGGAAIGDIGVSGATGIDTGRIKVSMEPGAKPQTAGDIIDYMSRAFNIVIRGKATHHKKSLGWFDPKATGIRLKDVRSLTTGTHEVAHHIDWTLNNRMSLKPPSKQIADELMALGRALYGSRKPPGGYKSEGWAEFIREYLTGEEAEDKAPNLYKWFMEEYLPSHKDMAKKIAKTRDMISKWRLQGAEARVDSQINKKQVKGPFSEWFKRGLLWIEAKWRDELAPIKRAMKRAGIREGELTPAEDPYQIAVARADKAGAVASQFILEYTTDMAGNRTGKGLREILAPVAKEINAFTRWIITARARLLHKKGINPGISKADTEYVYEKYDNEIWQNTLKELTDWNHRVLDYLVEAGGLDTEAANTIKKSNPIYIPFMRAFKEGELRIGGGYGRGVAKVTKPIKKIKGSGREIIDPIESMIKQTQKIIAVAHKAEIAKAIANLATKKGIASMIWKVPAPKQATRFEAEQLKKDIARIAYERMGLDPKEISSAMLEHWDDVLTVYSNAGQYYGKDNIVALVVDGNRQFYEVDPTLYKAIEGVDQYTLPWFLSIVLGKTTRMVRLGATGLNPSFGLIRNFLRDAMTFTVLSKHAKAGPLSAVKGIAEDVVDTPGAQKFKAMGGKMSSQILADRRAFQHLKKHVLASSVAGKTIYTVAHPIDALRELFGVTEAGTRIGEYGPALEAAEKKYGKGSKDAAIYALNQAQDVTTNFSRHGSIAKVLNQIIPFFNAAIQGPDKIIRTFGKRPGETLLKALLALTIPAIWLWWRHRDDEWYKNIPLHERVNYIHFKIPGKDIIIRIPVPFELGHIFQSAPVAALDAKYRKDPKIVTEMFEESLRQANPFDWPAAFGPIIDIMANEDFAGRPIVTKSAEYKLPEDQYGNYTTELMKIIGKTIGYSPAKLEHLVSTYSGGLYTRVARTIDLRKKKEITKSDMPVIGTLFLREPYAPRAQLNRFYEKRDLLNQKFSSGKITGKEKRLRKKYNEVSAKLSEQWKKIPDAKTQKDKIRIYQVMKRQLKKVGL